MNPNSRVNRATRFDSIALEGGHLVDDGFILRMVTGTAAAVLDEVDDVSTAGEIAERVAAAYPGGAAAVRHDVLGFLDQLASLRIIETIAAPAEPGYAIPSHVGYVVDEDTVILADLRDGRRQALGATGLMVWQLVRELHYSSAVIDQLLRDLPEAPPTLPADVERLLDELVEQGFLSRH